MNESYNSSVTGFQTLVDSERVARLPIGVVLLVLYTIGITGNSHVIHIFRSLPRRKTPSEAIILALAIFDIVTNLVFMFKEYNRIRFVLVDTSELICKISNFSGFTVGLASAFFVLVLALYRYRRLFTPNKKETTVLFTVIKLVVCSLIASLVSVPVLFIVGHQHFHIKTFTVNRCWLDEEQLYEELPTIYFSLFLCLSLFVSGVTGFCNVRIIHALRNSKNNIAKKGKDDMTIAHIEMKNETIIERDDFDSHVEATRQPVTNESPNSVNAGPTKTLSVVQNKQLRTSYQNKTPNTDDAKEHVIINEPQSTCGDDASRMDNGENKDAVCTREGGSPYTGGQENGNVDQMPPTRNGKKNEEVELQKSITFTITILIISFTILLSYMLFLGLFLYVILKRKEPGFSDVSIPEDVFYTYATDIVSLNAVINPFVYFFSDPTYRKYVRSIYTRKSKRFQGSIRLISY